MLLLDRVTIADDWAHGEFTVPAENCEGHEPMPGMRVMRGVEIPEMAFQLLGVLTAQLTAKYPSLADDLRGNICVAREITGAKFNGIIQPGDKLVLEASPEINVDEAAGIFRIESSKMIAKVEGKKKCTITFVAIASFDSAMIKK